MNAKDNASVSAHCPTMNASIHDRLVSAFPGSNDRRAQNLLNPSALVWNMADR
jgi:hypothetical protein